MLPVLSTLAGGYVLLCAMAFVLQRRLVYFPGPPPRARPSDVGLEYEQRTARTDDGLELAAWWIPGPGDAAVLVCHGNGGTMAEVLYVARAFRALGLGVLLFDYRGYGASPGQPEEDGLYLDAEAAWRLAVEELGVRPERLALYGLSLGGAVAIELALRRPAAALVVEASFTSLPEVGARAYPFLPVRWLTRERFPSLERVGRLTVPLLLLHSPDDVVVPAEHSARLQAAAPAGTRLVRTSGAHDGGGFTSDPRGGVAVAAFLEAHGLPSRAAPRAPGAR